MKSAINTKLIQIKLYHLIEFVTLFPFADGEYLGFQLVLLS